MTTTTNAMNHLLMGLDPYQRQQVAEFANYISNRAEKTPIGEMIDSHELKRVFQNMDPEVHGRVFELIDLLDVPRIRPFQGKMGVPEYSQAFDLNENALQKLKDVCDGSDVIDGLLERMPKSPAPERTRSDDIRDAIDEHMPRARVQRDVDNYTKDAADGLSLRQALQILMDVNEKFDGTRYDPREAQK